LNFEILNQKDVGRGQQIFIKFSKMVNTSKKYHRFINVFDVSKISVKKRRPGLRESASVLSCLRGNASYL
jgi:hypothetical protein